MDEHPPDASESRCDLLLSGGAVITMDDERLILEPGAVAITDDRISAVGSPTELAHLEAARTIDCRNRR